MFVYYYVQIQEPFESVEPRFLSMLGGLDGWAAESYREGETIHDKVGPGGDTKHIAKTVQVRTGTPQRSDAETAIPITWEATGTPGLFPKMEADLTIARVGPDLTQLALRGSYDPPLGAVGRVLNRTLLHRVAEASVKAFVDRIAAALDANGATSTVS